MATKGLFTTGLVILTPDEIKTELEDSFKSAFGESIDLDPSGPYGQLIGIMADRESDLWELLVSIKETFNPDGATGIQLDELSSITGTVREGATSSTAIVTLLGDISTNVPTGSSISTSSTSIEFETTEDSILVAPVAWSSSTTYITDDKVSSVTNIYSAVSGGTSGATTPSGTGSSIADNTVTWMYLGNSDAFFDTDTKSIDTGPLVALSGDLTVIETPISGWDSCINIEDATIGSNQETDAELRVKRVVELSSGSTSTYGGVTAAVSSVDGVTLAYLFENNTAVTNGDGVPGKSFETLVIGGEDDDLAVAIFDSKPIGILPYGSTTVDLTDSQGTVQTVGFSRPTDINIYITVNLIIDPYVYPDDGNTLVLDEILTLANSTRPGKDVVSSKIKSLCHNVTGVLDVVTAYIRNAPSPFSQTTIPIAIRELADYDSSRIIINTTDGNP